MFRADGITTHTFPMKLGYEYWTSGRSPLQCRVELRADGARRRDLGSDSSSRAGRYVADELQSSWTHWWVQVMETQPSRANASVI